MLEVKNYEVYGLERAVKASGLPMSADPDNVAYSDKRASVLGNAKAGSGHDCFLKGIIIEARVKYPLYLTKQFQRYHFADIVSSQSTMYRVTKFNIGEQCNEWVDRDIINIIQDKVNAYNLMEKENLNTIYLVKNLHEPYKFYESDPKELSYYMSNDFVWTIKEVSKKDLFMEIVSCLPSGFEMEMEIVTNYLQLKTIYK